MRPHSAGVEKNNDRISGKKGEEGDDHVEAGEEVKVEVEVEVKVKETRNKLHRLRPQAQAPEPMERRCFAVKEGLQPGGTAALMTPRLYRRAAHGKSLKYSQGPLQVIGLAQHAVTENCVIIYLKGILLSIAQQPFVEWRMNGCRAG